MSPSISPTFRPTPLDQWLADVQAMSAPTYIIEPFVPHDSLVFISGQPKTARKSFLAMLLALIAASGKSVGAMRCDKPVNVLYIYREGSAKRTAERFRAIAEGHGLPPAHTIQNLFIHHRGLYALDQADCVQQTCDFIKQNAIRMVIIDTLAKSCSINENDVKDAGRINNAFEHFRAAGATPVCVHHLRKGNAKLSDEKSGHFEPDEDMRGSTALAGGYEVHLAVRTAFDVAIGAKETFLLVSSKEDETTAYQYDWAKFDNRQDSEGHKFLAATTITLNKLEHLPYITGQKGRKGED